MQGLRDEEKLIGAGEAGRRGEEDGRRRKEKDRGGEVEIGKDGVTSSGHGVGCFSSLAAGCSGTGI